MPGSSFGHLFRISTFGESHGGCVGVVIDGCPAGLELCEDDIQPHLDRRRPGQSALTSPRKEEDLVTIQSGVFDGMTTGTPILIVAHNRDAKSEDYLHMKSVLRPSHADYTYLQKYGIRDWRGSGRASARETLARVAAGAVARKYLAVHHSIDIVAYVEQVGPIRAEVNPTTVSLDAVDASSVRCPEPAAAGRMIELIEEVMRDGDSIGGVVSCVVRGVPAGLGEPVFDKLHADLGKAMLSINAVKGFEIGSGFSAAEMRGSRHNDPFEPTPSGGVRVAKNDAGGVLGGITTGEDLFFRTAFKPVATIRRAQSTVTDAGHPVMLEAAGRHDPCVVPRAVPIVEGMAALVIVDHLLRRRADR